MNTRQVAKGIILSISCFFASSGFSEDVKMFRLTGEAALTLSELKVEGCANGICKFRDFTSNVKLSEDHVLVLGDTSAEIIDGQLNYVHMADEIYERIKDPQSSIANAKGIFCEEKMIPMGALLPAFRHEITCSLNGQLETLNEDGSNEGDPMDVDPIDEGVEEQLLGFMTSHDQISFQVFSGGCTTKEDFILELRESDPVQMVLKRIKPDYCEAYLPYGVILTYTLAEAGLIAGKKYKLVNQLSAHARVAH